MPEPVTQKDEEELKLMRERIELEREMLSLERERVLRETRQLEEMKTANTFAGHGAGIPAAFWLVVAVFVLAMGLLLGWGIGYDVGREHSPKPRPVKISRTLAEGLTRVWAEKPASVEEECGAAWQTSSDAWSETIDGVPVWAEKRRLWHPENSFLIW
ncbi:MAG: hypothetical protein ACI4QT_06705 [Kiritimatiellia bacterium]